MNISQNNNLYSTEFRIPFCIDASPCLKYLRQVRVFISVFRCFLCSIFVIYAETKADKNKILKLLLCVGLVYVEKSGL